MAVLHTADSATCTSMTVLFFSLCLSSLKPIRKQKHKSQKVCCPVWDTFTRVNSVLLSPSAPCVLRSFRVRHVTEGNYMRCRVHSKVSVLGWSCFPSSKLTQGTQLVQVKRLWEKKVTTKKRKLALYSRASVLTTGFVQNKSKRSTSHLQCSAN